MLMTTANNQAILTNTEVPLWETGGQGAWEKANLISASLDNVAHQIILQQVVYCIGFRGFQFG